MSSAIAVGIAVLVPDYTIRLLFFGNVKVRYLAGAFLVLDLLGVSGGNPGGNIAHLGGAFLGYIYIKSSEEREMIGVSWIIPKKKKHPFKVYKNENPVASNDLVTPDQAYIDSILDKI